MRTVLLYSLALLWLLMIGSARSTPRLHAQQRYIQVDADRTNETNVLCTLRDEVGKAVPIARCEFKDYHSKSFWKFQGPSTPVQNDGRYFGAGLSEGECGLTLEVSSSNKDFHMLACRVVPAGGGEWRYAATLVKPTNLPQFAYIRQPHFAVYLPGSNLTITGSSSSRKIYMCRTSRYNHANTMWMHHSTINYGSETCDSDLSRWSKPESGFIVSFVISEETGDLPMSWGGDFTELIVADAPKSAPQLVLNTTNVALTAGAILRATCLVPKSSPVSNVTWYLDDVVIRNDDVNEAPVDDAWSWNHDPRQIWQHLVYKLEEGDAGKVLKCQAGHLALPGGTLDSNTHVIRF